MEYWCQRYRGAASRAAVRPAWPMPTAGTTRASVPHDSRWQLDLPDWDATRRYLQDTLDAALDALSGCPTPIPRSTSTASPCSTKTCMTKPSATRCQTLGWPGRDGLADLPAAMDIGSTAANS
jgi:hypothetical protein